MAQDAQHRQDTTQGRVLANPRRRRLAAPTSTGAQGADRPPAQPGGPAQQR